MKFNARYYEYLKSKEWKKKREQTFEFHGRKCKTCGKTERLEINHLHYKTFYKENPATDLEVLCRRCHRQHHGLVFRRKDEPKKAFSRRAKKFRRVFSGLAITMDQYRADGANPYLKGKHFKPRH